MWTIEPGLKHLLILNKWIETWLFLCLTSVEGVVASKSWSLLRWLFFVIGVRCCAKRVIWIETWCFLESWFYLRYRRLRLIELLHLVEHSRLHHLLLLLLLLEHHHVRHVIIRHSIELVHTYLLWCKLLLLLCLLKIKGIQDLLVIVEIAQLIHMLVGLLIWHLLFHLIVLLAKFS